MVAQVRIPRLEAGKNRKSFAVMAIGGAKSSDPLAPGSAGFLQTGGKNFLGIASRDTGHGFADPLPSQRRDDVFFRKLDGCPAARLSAVPQERQAPVKVVYFAYMGC